MSTDMTHIRIRQLLWLWEDEVERDYYLGDPKENLIAAMQQERRNVVRVVKKRAEKRETSRAVAQQKASKSKAAAALAKLPEAQRLELLKALEEQDGAK